MTMNDYEAKLEWEKQEREEKRARQAEKLVRFTPKFLYVVPLLSLLCLLLPIYPIVALPFAFPLLAAGGASYVHIALYCLLTAGALSLTMTGILYYLSSNKHITMLMALYGVFLVPGFALLLGGCVELYEVEGWDVSDFTRRAEQALKHEYAQPGYEQWSAAVDKAQQHFHCCAFRDRSWHVWKLSSWHDQQESTYSKPCVPKSCCRQHGDNSTHYLHRCQRNLDGAPCAGGVAAADFFSSSVAPPISLGDAENENEAVFYDGCTGHLYWVMGHIGLAAGIFGIFDGCAVIILALIAMMQ